MAYVKWITVQVVCVMLAACIGGFVAGSIAQDPVTADQGRMSAAVPVMSEAEVRATAASPLTDLATTTISPVRILDTRPDSGSLGGTKVPWGAGEVRTVDAAGLGPIPADAVGVIVNVTALNASAPDTFLTLFPTGQEMPNASTLNPTPEGIAFNAATVLLGQDGTFEIYNYSGTVDVIVDVTAYMTRTLAEDVVRLQTGELLLPLQGIPSNGGFYFPFSSYSDWRNYNGGDPDGVFGAQVPEGRYSDSAAVELTVAVNNPSGSAFFGVETCFAIHSTVDGLIDGSEICIDGSLMDRGKFTFKTSERVKLPPGTLTVYVKVSELDGSCESREDQGENVLCDLTLKWFGFRVFDA